MNLFSLYQMLTTKYDNDRRAMTSLKLVVCLMACCKKGVWVRMGRSNLLVGWLVA